MKLNSIKLVPLAVAAAAILAAPASALIQDGHPEPVTAAACDIDLTVPLRAHGSFQAQADSSRCSGVLDSKPVGDTSTARLTGSIGRDGSCDWKLTDGVLLVAIDKLQLTDPRSSIVAAAESGLVRGGTRTGQETVAYETTTTLAALRAGSARAAGPRCSRPRGNNATVSIQLVLRERAPVVLPR